MKLRERRFYDDQWSFLEIVSVEDDVGVVIRGHLFIESALLRLIEKGFAKPNAVDLANVNFPLKIDLAIALGSLPESLRSALLMVNKLRNDFAHGKTAHVSERESKALIESLPSKERDYWESREPDFKGFLAHLYGRQEKV